ncbi:MAG: type II toxin-antitoxin system ParD family antitoxin [Sphingorhabdus sp.]
MAAKNTSIALGKPYTDFIYDKVESGEFATGSEVVREALRQYMHEDAKIVALRSIIQKSIDSGPSVEFDIDTWFEEKFGDE